MNFIALVSMIECRVKHPTSNPKLNRSMRFFKYLFKVHFIINDGEKLVDTNVCLHLFIHITLLKNVNKACVLYNLMHLNTF